MSDGPSFPPAVAGPAPEPKKRRSVWAVLATILLLLSVAANAVLVLLVIVLAATVSASFSGGVTEDILQERVLLPGPGSQKIAVIYVGGFIDEDLTDSLHAQIQRAADDDRVKAVILRINSPGGGLTETDMIYHDVRALLAESDKPIIAAMDGVAASGGYYIACSADHIIAQPTTVTGSIGVIAQLFFLQGLMQDKLGVTPVTLKMGEQKDWPNIFGDAGLTEEQRRYLMDSLLVPGYERFVGIVADGRGLERAEVLRLATGRIYTGDEALAVGLVDEVGYFESAVEAALRAAGLEEARVVEYVEPFSLSTLLGVSARVKERLDLAPEKLAALASPKVMYLWTGF